MKVRKEKYRRKGNPAVELMRRVIQDKERNDWPAHNAYTSRNKYTKLVASLNDVSERTLQQGGYKRMPYLKDHVEVCNATGRYIMPLSINEKLSRVVTRNYGAAEKEITEAERHEGLDELLELGDITEAGLADVFSEVDITDDDIRILQRRITSPLSRRTALSFYRYYIEDTLTVDGTKLYELSFRPNNRQDFGFSGVLLVSADSICRLHYATLTLPRQTGINWIDGLTLTQGFTTLPTGERVLESDVMTLQLLVMEGVQKALVQRTTQYSAFATDSLPAHLFAPATSSLPDPALLQRDPAFWASARPLPLTQAEERITAFKDDIFQTRGFKPLLWVARALVNNNIPLTLHPDTPAKLDLTPVNTLISFNPVEKARIRLSARTTAHLWPHLFLKGYAAYGFKDRRWKGLGEITYAFNRRQYMPGEFPVHNLTLTYQNDLMRPADKFLETDKDNVFTSLKWTKAESMMYFERVRLLYEREWTNGLRFHIQLRREHDRAAGTMQFLRTDSTHLAGLTVSDATVGLYFRPGAKYFTSKRRRKALNQEAPIYSLTHTTGLSGVLGGQYRYNITEIEHWRRLQLNSWGKLDISLRGGVQWNRVPFPLLLMPASNLSYIKQRNTYGLVNNMEFLYDRYASLMLGWDMSGKLFNRIPLMNRLKWREYLGLNVLWGTLSHKNRPQASPAGPADDTLLLLPEGSSLLDPHTPYVEGIVGIHNILNLLHVEYVHRFTYRHLPTANRWGIRLKLVFGF